jgi:hypothetical protein
VLGHPDPACARPDLPFWVKSVFRCPSFYPLKNKYLTDPPTARDKPMTGFEPVTSSLPRMCSTD